MAFFGPDAAGLSEMFIVGVDGRGLRQITTLPSESISGPSWSPDSKRIAFSTVYLAGAPWVDGDGGSVLWTINRDGSELKPILSLPGYIQTPGWSPDGKQIVFSHQPTGTISPSLVEVVPSSGGVPSLLSGSNQFVADHPVWSPNGTVVAYNGDGTLWFVRRDGTARHQLGCDTACSPNTYRSVTWSPDGQWLAIPQPNDESVTVVHPDGASARSIGPVSEVDRYPYRSGPRIVSPAWSPDSHRVAFIQGTFDSSYDSSATTDVVAVDVQVGTAKVIADAPSLDAYAAQIDWSRR